MMSKFLVASGLIFFVFILSGCDKNMPQVYDQTIGVKFVNSAGENLIEKNKVEIDSTKTNIVNYFIKESEYSLDIKINGDDYYTPDLPLIYNGLNWRGYGLVEFGCWAHNSNLKNKRNPFTYEFNFVCPKLFGDNEPRKIEVVWDTRRKTMYNIINEIRFNGENVVHDDNRDHKVTIVLK